jgi:hypothetical protein
VIGRPGALRRPRGRIGRDHHSGDQGEVEPGDFSTARAEDPSEARHGHAQDRRADEQVHRVQQRFLEAQLRRGLGRRAGCSRRIEAGRLFSATRLSALRDLALRARVWTMSSTTAGRRPMAIEAARADRPRGNRGATSAAKTAAKVRGSPRHPRRRASSRASSVEVHAPPEVEEHQAEREVDEDARLVDKGIEGQGLGSGAITPPTTT